MRVVIDTNVLVSGLLWRGAPHALIEQARAGRFTIVSSSPLLDELAEVVGRRKFRTILLRSTSDPRRMVRDLRRLAEIVEAPPLTKPASRDSDDDAVLAVATTARADLIVSGDDDLLTLVGYNGIPIVDPLPHWHGLADEGPPIEKSRGAGAAALARRAGRARFRATGSASGAGAAAGRAP